MCVTYMSRKSSSLCASLYLCSPSASSLRSTPTDQAHSLNTYIFIHFHSQALNHKTCSAPRPTPCNISFLFSPLLFLLCYPPICLHAHTQVAFVIGASNDASPTYKRMRIASNIFLVLVALGLLLTEIFGDVTKIRNEIFALRIGVVATHVLLLGESCASLFYSARHVHECRCSASAGAKMRIYELSQNSGGVQERGGSYGGIYGGGRVDDCGAVSVVDTHYDDCGVTMVTAITDLTAGVCV